jgi:hypothetical protein
LSYFFAVGIYPLPDIFDLDTGIIAAGVVDEEVEFSSVGYLSPAQRRRRFLLPVEGAVVVVVKVIESAEVL